MNCFYGYVNLAGRLIKGVRSRNNLINLGCGLLNMGAIIGEHKYLLLPIKSARGE